MTNVHQKVHYSITKSHSMYHPERSLVNTNADKTPNPQERMVYDVTSAAQYYPTGVSYTFTRWGNITNLVVMDSCNLLLGVMISHPGKIKMARQYNQTWKKFTRLVLHSSYKTTRSQNLFLPSTSRLPWMWLWKTLENSWNTYLVTRRIPSKST